MITFAPTLAKGLSPGNAIRHADLAILGAQTQTDSDGRAGDPERSARNGWAMKSTILTARCSATVTSIIVFSERASPGVCGVTAVRQRQKRADSASPVPANGPGGTAGNSPKTRQRRVWSLDDERFLIVYFGYVYKGKGSRRSSRRLRIAVSRRRDLRLLHGRWCSQRQRQAGAVSRRACKATSRTSGLEGHVIVDRRLSLGQRHAVPATFGPRDMCILPFDRGVYLNNSSFAAAASHGLPILSTRPDLVESAFVDGQNVLFCPPGNPRRWRAIVRLVDDSALRSRLREGVRRMAAGMVLVGSSDRANVETMTPGGSDGLSAEAIGTLTMPVVRRPSRSTKYAVSALPGRLRPTLGTKTRSVCESHPSDATQRNPAASKSSSNSVAGVVVHVSEVVRLKHSSDSRRRSHEAP